MARITFGSRAKKVRCVLNDAAVGIKKGERVLSIIWYDRITDYKYVKLDDLCQVSVASVLVTVSNISWQRVTTNRFYL